jgi:SAM-dependent methyltransferase
MNPLSAFTPAQLHWQDGGQTYSALWRSENGAPPPKRVVVANDTMSADTAYRLVCEGTALLWSGDFHNARHMLQALARRLDKSLSTPSRLAKKRAQTQPATPREAFNTLRLAQSQRARTLGMVLVPLNADFSVPLRRAPDWRQACIEAYGENHTNKQNAVVSLRELLGVLGAHEWRKKGVPIAQLNASRQGMIYPHYGVFSPIRGEYLNLVANAPLPKWIGLHAQDTMTVFDIGTGTGVIAALLAQRLHQLAPNATIVATDLDPRALVCAADNIERLGYSSQVTVVQADLFPPLERFGQAQLLVCNPPWLPARPSSPLERAVYDPDSQMLKGFLQGVRAHLAPHGEAWLILSDLAEHLGLRSREVLLDWIELAGLKVLGKRDIAPLHGKAFDSRDALHAARSAELTSLWRLGAR